MSEIIGIIGCGWLGKPLAISFVKDKHVVHGSTTSKEKIDHLAKEGILPFMISLSEDGINGDISGFLSCVNLLVINVPPKLRGKGSKENYVKKMHFLHQEITKAKVTKVIFVSSTSVYGDNNGEVTENSIPQPTTESGKQLLASEAIFKNDKSLQTTIIRFGGLIGPKRHPVTMLSGRKGLPNGNVPINLIHLNDCINIIKSIVYNNWWGAIFNGVYPFHPSKEKYYTQKALELGIKAPEYETGSKTGKMVRSQALLYVKKYIFTTTV